MKRLVLPLLFAFYLPSLLLAETSIEQHKATVKKILDEHEQFVHNNCLKYIDYEFCRELDRKTWKVIGDLKKRDKSSMFKLIGDICEAGEKGLLAKPYNEYYLLREIYKAHYPATEEEKKIILYENYKVRSDVFEIAKYTSNSFPGCLSRQYEK